MTASVEGAASGAGFSTIVRTQLVCEGFVYAASICYPQTDLYVPVSITISTDGKISMKKEELLEEVYEEDTSGR